MKADVFDFWADVPSGTQRHPADVAVLNHVKHRFQLQCLPGPFKGPLRTAKVVILALSPGFDEKFDPKHAKLPEGQNYYHHSWTGSCDLPSATDHDASAKWSARIIRQFDLSYNDIRSKIAFMNIAPYKSKAFSDWHMLSALPSCRVALTWAQSVLFQQAESSQRVVVCVRSARRWGLEPGFMKGQLFAPLCGQGGIMHHGPHREVVKAAVLAACRD